MRKTIITASLLVLLTLSLTQLATSQEMASTSSWKDNVFTNQTSGDLYVAFTTYRPATSAYPLGWRTVAWYRILPGGSHTFQAFRENPIYYLIYEANTTKFLRPDNAKSFKGWEYVAPFVIVSKDEPDTFTPAVDLLFTTHARTSNLLVENSHYFKSANTGSVTVTPTGVNAPLAELELVARPAGTEDGTESRPTGGQTSGATSGQTPGAWSISGISSGQLKSGQSKTVSVTVTSTDGTNMEGATVTFSEDSDFLEFNPTSATTNSSGVASSTLSSKGEESEAQTVSVSVSGSSEGAKSYSITVPHDTVSMQDSYTVTSLRASLLSCVGRRAAEGWYNWATSSSPKYITFDYPILTYSTPVEQVSSLSRQFITLSGYGIASASARERFAIWGRARKHCIAPNVMTVVVNATGKYVAADFGLEAPSSSGAPPLQPQLRPEPEQLSAVWQDLSEIPSETALLPNYPNPFNPETWIPYHLAEPADVTLHIYAADGKQVRTLALGHQSAGIYENRSRAAYWDGRNTTGERVASGLYFYTLTAGDFAATKKMLIMK